MIAGGASLAPRRWSLAAEAIDARSRSAWTSTARMAAHQEDQELHVGVGVVRGSSRLTPGVGGHRPVVVLARAVDAGERLLVQQRLEAVARRHPLQRLHDEHLVVGGDVARLEERRDLVLAGRDLVVPGLDRHAEPVELPLGLGHAGEHPRRDGAEVVVLELLALGRLGAEQGALAGQQVGPREVEVPVDQEVLLLGADRGVDPGDARVGAEEPQDAQRLLRERLHRAEQRGLGVERLAGPATRTRSGCRG